MEVLTSNITSYPNNIESQNDIEIQYQNERGKPMPSLNHAKLQALIAAYFVVNYGDIYDIFTEIEVELLDKRAVPDLAIYPIQATDWESDVIRRTDAPILTIEILSPKQALDDILSKIRTIYFPGGVQSSWVVIPAMRTISVMTLDKKIKSYTEGIVNDEVSGFEIDLNKIFK